MFNGIADPITRPKALLTLPHYVEACRKHAPKTKADIRNGTYPASHERTGSDTVTNAKSALEQLTAQMEATRARFLKATKEWLGTAIPAAVESAILEKYCEDTVKLGSDGTQRLKREIDSKMLELDALVEENFGEDRLWRARPSAGLQFTLSVAGQKSTP